MTGGRSPWRLWTRHLVRLAAPAAAGALLTLLVVPGSPLGALPGSARPVGAPTEWQVAARTAQGSGGQEEGIQVRGDWLIEVLNSDGTVAEQHAFKNALTWGYPESGAVNLAKVLGRSRSVGQWAVVLDSAVPADKPCHRTLNGQTVPSSCASVETTTGWVLGAAVPTLSVSVPETGPDTGKLTLKGTVIADRTGKIDVVYTRSRWCDATSAPSSPCQTGIPNPFSPGEEYFPFTSKAVNPGVQVAAGQQVAITVVISFS